MQAHFVLVITTKERGEQTQRITKVFRNTTLNAVVKLISKHLNFSTEASSSLRRSREVVIAVKDDHLEPTLVETHLKILEVPLAKTAKVSDTEDAWVTP